MNSVVARDTGPPSLFALCCDGKSGRHEQTVPEGSVISRPQHARPGSLKYPMGVNVLRDSPQRHGL